MIADVQSRQVSNTKQELLSGRQYVTYHSVIPGRQVQTQSRESDVIQSEIRYFGLLFM